jgi:hypothetical protein
MSVTIGDLNGDGKPDLVIANAGDNNVSVLLNTTAPGASTPSFAAAQSFATESQPASVALVDLNGDGKLDIVVADDSAAGTVSVLLNATAPGSTTPSFANHINFVTGPNPTSVAIGDINYDGRPDLIVANSGSNTVSVLINGTAPGATTPVFPITPISPRGRTRLLLLLPTSMATADPTLSSPITARTTFPCC